MRGTQAQNYDEFWFLASARTDSARTGGAAVALSRCGGTSTVTHWPQEDSRSGGLQPRVHRRRAERPVCPC